MTSSLRHLSYQFQRCVSVRSRLASTSTPTPYTAGFRRLATLSTQSPSGRFFSSSDTSDNDKKTDQQSTLVAESNERYDAQEIMESFRDTSYFNPVEKPDYSHLTNEELDDSSTIPGWEMIHSPPKDRSVPRGALVGTVVSTKMQKTVNVAVDRYKIHAKYRKRLRYTRKFMAHDEKEVANTGDLVMITPCHRISKHKHFMLREIIRSKGQL